ncbi:MAG: hypothetical protein NVS2B12_08090 [Ktedonobacteraceae bacterium]
MLQRAYKPAYRLMRPLRGMLALFEVLVLAVSSATQTLPER